MKRTPRLLKGLFQIIDATGNIVLNFFAGIGKFTLLVIQTFRWLFVPPFDKKEILNQMVHIGYNSLPVTLITSLLILIYIIHKLMPRDRLIHNLPVKPRFYVVYKLSVFTSLLLSALIMYFSFTYGINQGVTMLLLAGIFLIPGIVAKMIERYVTNIDNFFPIFIRSFGLTYSVLPNIRKTILSLLRGDYGNLTICVKRL